MRAYDDRRTEFLYLWHLVLDILYNRCALNEAHFTAKDDRRRDDVHAPRQIDPLKVIEVPASDVVDMRC